MTNLPSFIESLRGFDTRREEYVIHPIDTRCRPEKKSYFVRWNQIDITVDTILRRPWYDAPWEREEENWNKNEKEKFFQKTILKMG